MKVTPIYFECPACCITLQHKPAVETAANEAITYSDEFVHTDDFKSRSRLVKCPVCNEVFFIDDQPILAEYKGTPCAETEFPEIDDWFEVSAKFKAHENAEKLRYLRTEIWYMGNHHAATEDALFNNSELKMKWIDNLDELEKLLDEQNPKQVLIKAEVNRQLGRFSRCLDLLENASAENDNKFIKTIRKKVRKEQTDIFEM